MWWVGAVFLVAGNVVVGSKDETKEASAEAAYAPVLDQEQEDGLLRRKDDEDEDVVDLGIVDEGRDR